MTKNRNVFDLDRSIRFFHVINFIFDDVSSGKCVESFQLLFPSGSKKNMVC